ncbi:GNAT family N-acetyltransferase [Sutcliffiella sp. NC1]|uniref:GNAT family N-acetyltransferase n=1 Tax=Sutcliffiella sp. NC1 TaxID=3004096 RepID=UPI0022DDC721|nr:GNAT family N-acetyltransferase [Sutcliffiella sp. NC1]WBL13616.1 GNAT family N-acetyltransferase [Sutcliffiella sp. NC1]
MQYTFFNGIPNEELMKGIQELHQKVFGTSEDLLTKMKTKPTLLFHIAIADEKIVGYKIGYILSSDKFYSWLGGVDPSYRNKGIAATLMKNQHQYLKEAGYKTVQTKTMNKWRNMLILNIKSGFDVIETYVDDKGLHKIVLEKSLE